MRRFPRTPLESQEQTALFTWALMHVTQEPKLKWLFAIPNGELRDKRTGEKLRAMGVVAGVPDLCLPVPMRYWHGLYLELKRIGGGTPSFDQRRWLCGLDALGYRTVICRGWTEAAYALAEYLERLDLAPSLL